jgi:hypothetical protein
MIITLHKIIFDWRWLLLYAALNDNIPSDALLATSSPANYQTEGIVPELQKPKPIVLSLLSLASNVGTHQVSG